MVKESKLSVEKLRTQVNKSQELIQYFQNFSTVFKRELQFFYDKYYEQHGSSFE